MIEISYDFVDVKAEGFNPSECSVWLKKVLENYNVSNVSLSYVFVSDEYLLGINQEHLGHDYYTDIITFNYNEEDSLSGEMFISLDRVRENAEEFSKGIFLTELSRVMVHGVLHLLGYNDHTEEEEKIIREQEDICLNLK